MRSLIRPISWPPHPPHRIHALDAWNGEPAMMSASAARIRPFLLAAVAALAAYACGDEARTTEPDAGDGTVRGTVTSAKTSAGIPNLIVVLLRDGRAVRSTPTDADGAFAFRDIARGSYGIRLTGLELTALSARHTAFEPVEMAITVAETPVDVLFAAVGLIPPRIVGTVQCAGALVEGARVRVIGGETDEIVTTNAQGRYGATGLTAGQYAVIVVEAPCTIAPPYRAASLRPGQAAEVNFEG